MRRYQAAGGADWRRPSLRQRFGVLGLVALIELAILLLVLLFGGSRLREPVAPAASTAITFISASPEREVAPLQRKQAPREAARPEAVAPRPVPRLPTASEPLPYVPVSKADLDAGDIARLGTAASGGASLARGEAAPAVVGEGPGGVQLYAAEWVVEPSDAQLRPFLPAEVERGSWALIACRTIAHNHVENCAQLGEGPRGSGLAKAMRLAAWQFKVRPPRIDGKPMVGAWVRIRIDFGKERGRE